MNKIIIAYLCAILLDGSTGASVQHSSPPFHEAELIFPLESWHNHVDGEGKPARKSIKHAHFNEEWVMLGDAK